MWEFEDALVNLGVTPVQPHDLASLVFVEFATIFGNDRLMAPNDLPRGVLARVTGLSNTGSFAGKITLAKGGVPRDGHRGARGCLTVPLPPSLATPNLAGTQSRCPPGLAAALSRNLPAAPRHPFATRRSRRPCSIRLSHRRAPARKSVALVKKNRRSRGGAAAAVGVCQGQRAGTRRAKQIAGSDMSESPQAADPKAPAAFEPPRRGTRHRPPGRR